MKKTIEADVLIIGTGIAGCCAALTLAEKKINVILINKMEKATESNTRYAQGGIVGKADNDIPELLTKDIIEAGDYLGNEAAIFMLSDEGPQMVLDFLVDQVDVDFSKDNKGNIQCTSEGAHTIRRIFHVMDYTGKEIIEKLIKKVNENSYIKMFTSHMAIDLITTGHHSVDPLTVYQDNKCLGAYVLDSNNQEVLTFFAKKTILATGGIGALFLYSSNPSSATGDGLAMAYRSGAEIINAEYIQFHPTTLFHRDANRFLISESLRGEGGRLVNHEGEYFMEKYDSRKDLAPRDVISRAIYEETLKSDYGCVFLDLQEVVQHGIDVKKRFPTIYNKCYELGLDITKEFIPVVPSAHYFCGGVKADLYGRTTVKNLYAVGEVSCTGIHGANRLASISLLEGLVWGIKAGEDISRTISLSEAANDYNNISNWKAVTSPEIIDPVLILQDWLTIKTTMWNYTGIVRTKKRLVRANADLSYLSHRIEQFYKESFLTKELIELRNGIISALIIVRSALRNEKSMGCHFRVD